VTDRPPQVIVISGPNGAGKTTAAEHLLRGAMSVQHFVNADWIARGLGAFDPDSVALEAGRAMLARLKQLAASRSDFAFETTLASRTFAPWIGRLCASGYEFSLLHLWLPDPEQAVSRVADRVRGGGHDVPADVIRRRYHAGLRNFFDLYQPLATTWRFYENAGSAGPRLIAAGRHQSDDVVSDRNLWQLVQAEYRS
jgi:predicted ABC-type ATPase